MKKTNQRKKINLTEYREEVVAKLAALTADARNTKESLNEVKSLLREQNGRIGKNEAALGWVKGIGTVLIGTYSTLLAWLFNK